MSSLSVWQIGAECGLGGGVVWMMWRLERDERDAVMIDRKVMEQGRKEIRKRMDTKPEWLRRCIRKWNAAGRLGSQKLNEETKR